MSRSIRHAPVHGWCCAETDKWWKVLNHRRHRRRTREALRAGQEPPHEKETSNDWTTPKDGKVWCGWDELRHGYKGWRGNWVHPYRDFGK